jgi:hypothetical protein
VELLDFSFDQWEPPFSQLNVLKSCVTTRRFIDACSSLSKGWLWRHTEFTGHRKSLSAVCIMFVADY